MHKFQANPVPIYSDYSSDTDVDVFSTPPSTPDPTTTELRPSLSRRSSRPSSLQLSHTAADWNTSIVVDNQPSPDPTTLIPPPHKTHAPIQSPSYTAPNGVYVNSVNGHTTTSSPSVNGHHNSTHAVSPHSLAPTPKGVTYPVQAQLSQQIISSSSSNAQSIHNQNNHLQQHQYYNQPSSLTQHPTQFHHQHHSHQQPHQQYHHSPESESQGSTSTTMPSAMTSPCFVHSQLQGASLGDWLREKQIQDKRPIRLGDGYRYQERDVNGVEAGYNRYLNNIEDEGSTGSLTKQLAETAVGVREMSKQLGRARVHSTIQSILIVTKARDNRLIKLTRELALYLMLKPQKGGRGMIVYVDSQLKTSRRFDAASIERDHPELFVPYPRRRSTSSSSVSSSSTTFSTKDLELKSLDEEGQLRYWTPEMCSRSPQLFDFVVTLGGDGTVLFTSWLFQRIVPPVLPFALGSLGFLTNFDFSDHQSVVDLAIDSGIRVNLRMRFTCTVYRAVSLAEEQKSGKFRRKAIKKAETGEILMKNLEMGGWEALESGYSAQAGKCAKDKEIKCFTTRPVESFEILNDLVVDRGPSPYVSLLELFGDEHHLTTVQADGLTISTPTGSTAYSLSAGGSLVHPEIPAILITPICPHTLSFRPMLLPDSMELRICVPFNSRSTAWASFDGRGRVELKQGDHIKVTASKYPFPTVCADSQSVDWFHSISRTLKWNERERQKSFVVVEEGPSSKRSSISRKVRKRRSATIVGSSAGTVESKISPTFPRSRSKSVGSVDGPFGENGKEEEEEDEASSSGEEEEEEKFDIDDLSSNDLESSPKSGNILSTSAAEEVMRSTRASSFEERVGREKALENELDVLTGRCEKEKEKDKQQVQAEVAARSLVYGNPHLGSLLPAMRRKTRSKSRERRSSRSRSRSGLRSGLETPDRFAGPHPHPPKLSPRHVQFMNISNNSSSSSVNEISSDTAKGDGTVPLEMGREQTVTGVLRKGFVDGREESMKTPTVSVGSVNGEEEERRGREPEVEGVTPSPYVRRAFAVWGQDESDSATSDSDSG